MAIDSEKADGEIGNIPNRDVEESAANVEKSQQNGTLNMTTSKADSEATLLERIPKSERRGLLGRFSIIPEVTNPYDYGNSTKWWMTIVVSFAAITSSTGSSIFYRECLFPICT